MSTFIYRFLRKGILVSEDEVVQAIRSFLCGSAGGPDGVSPQH